MGGREVELERRVGVLEDRLERLVAMVHGDGREYGLLTAERVDILQTGLAGVFGRLEALETARHEGVAEERVTFLENRVHAIERRQGEALARRAKA